MYILVNAAMSVDGKLASHRREQLRISGDSDFARVDRRRAEADGIMVGVGTVLADDPSLTRFDHDRRAELDISGRPARVVADSRGRTPPDAALLNGAAPTYVLTTTKAPPDRIKRLRNRGATVITAGEDRVDLTAALSELECSGIDTLFVEGGGELIFSLFDAGLVDDLAVYVGALLIGGRNAPTLADGEGFVGNYPELTLTDVTRLDAGVVLHWHIES